MHSQDMHAEETDILDTFDRCFKDVHLINCNQEILPFSD